MGSAPSRKASGVVTSKPPSADDDAMPELVPKSDRRKSSSPTASNTSSPRRKAPPKSQLSNAQDDDSDEDISHVVGVVDRDKAERLLWEYCKFIFNKADQDGDGYLNEDEFSSVVQSKTLNLNVNNAEAAALMRGATSGKGNVVAFEQFVPVMKSLMSRRALRQQEANVKGWQWYVMYFDDNPDSLPVFYNTQQDIVTYDRPPGVQLREQAENANFETLVRSSDGMMITSYVNDDGLRMYLDWETGEWLQLPDEWLQDIQVMQDDDDQGWDAQPGLERFEHPITGEEVETSFEGGMRLFFDSSLGEWVPIPLALEKYVPSVMAALEVIEEKMPEWHGINEKIMALRHNSYDARATLAWKRLELSYDDGQGEPSGDPSFSATSLRSRQQAAEAELQQVGDELAIASLKQELGDAQALVDLQKARIAALELQSEAKSSADDAANQRKLEQQQARIESMTKELEALKAGGELKDALAEKERVLSTLQDEHATLSEQLATTRKKQAAAFSRLQFDVKALKTKQDALRSMVNEGLGENMVTLIRETQTQVMGQVQTIVANATKDIVAKYRYEVRQRKLLYNKLQELKGNIRVFCRVRRDDRVTCVLSFPDYHGLGTPTEIVCPNAKDEKDKKKFEFDRVYSPESTQEEVFEDTEAVITSCVDGYNTCIIAYGQTGSGKTFTMMGPPDNIGVNKRAVAELLRICQERDDVDYTLKVSLLEIYNEKITDLLAPSMADQNCDIRQDPTTKRNYVTNLTERPFSTVEDIIQTLADGDANRHIASTKMNSQSSRSHLILTITIDGQDRISNQSSSGRLTLVDLAGSERVAKTEATGQRLVEAAAINKSLTALGQVFAALRTSQSHVPYRNSKLTHLLQDSLGGDSKTCVFINVSPAESNLSETMSTLKFGQAIRTIELGPMGKQGKKAAAKQ